MQDKRDSWIGKLVQIDVVKAGEWWENRCYSHYLYRVVNVISTSSIPLAHLRIVNKLPGKNGKPGIEMSDRRGDTVNVHLRDLIMIDNLKNVNLVNLLEKE